MNYVTDSYFTLNLLELDKKKGVQISVLLVV